MKQTMVRLDRKRMRSIAAALAEVLDDMVDGHNPNDALLVIAVLDQISQDIKDKFGICHTQVLEIDMGNL